MRELFVGTFGSHLYGLNTPESDTDRKGIFIPAPKDIILGTVKTSYSYSTGNDRSKNSKDDIDVEMFTLKEFVRMSCKGETCTLDMLHTPENHVIKTSGVWEYLQRNRSAFYCTDMKAYLGYVMKQASKYGVKGSRLAALRQVVDIVSINDCIRIEPVAPGARGVRAVDIRLVELAPLLPENEFCFWEKDGDNLMYYVLMGRKYVPGIKAKEFRQAVLKLWAEYGDRARKAEANEGIDWKALSHAMRGGLQLLEIYQTGDLKYPLKNAERLKQVKAGVLPFKEVQEELETIVHSVETEVTRAKANGMPSKPDEERWNNFVYDVYCDRLVDYFG